MPIRSKDKQTNSPTKNTSNEYFTTLNEARNQIALNSSSIKFLQLNVRGISNIHKFNKICTLINVFKCNFDVIALTEVKLKSTFPVQLYNIKGFNRYTSLRSDLGGGGVIVFVNEGIQVENPIATSATFEKLNLTLSINAVKLRLIVYYRAPTTSNLSAFMNDLESELSASDLKTCILGDININSFTLCVNKPPTYNIDIQYEELLSSYGYSVTNTLPTRPASGRTIDHFIANFYNKLVICNHTVEVDPSITDHNIVMSTISWRKMSPRKVKEVTIKKIDYKKLAQYFPDVTPQLDSNNANSIAEAITKAIQTATTTATTTKTYVVKHSERINDWTSEKSIKLLLEKDKLLNKHRKKPNSTKINDDLKEVSDKLKALTKTEYAEHIRKQVATKDPKKLWRNLNNILGKGVNKTEPKSVNANGTDLLDPTMIANEFNRFFTTCAEDLMSTLNQLDATPQEVELQPQNSLVLIPPDAVEVSNIIRQMKTKSAAGHDGIGPKVLKTLSHKLVPLLVHLIAVIFATGIYPRTFKQAVVTPIFKSGSRKNVDNYRPISVLPLLNKIVEKALHRRLLVYVSDHLNLIYDHQFGFRPKSGTENATIEMTNLITKAIDQNKIVTGIFMDLKKAFDIVNHDLLLEVLHKYGVRGNTLKLFTNYLEERFQVVKIGSSRSSKAPIKAGVVQGSCLGPLLYLIFINAIGSLKLMGKLFLFADDAVLINLHESRESMVESIKIDMTTVLEFFKQRHMILNSLKTNYMVFTSSYSQLEFDHEIKISDQVTIQRVKMTKYLGLFIDENLRWQEHIGNLEKKLAPANGVLWKLRSVLPTHVKKLIYETLFHTHLNYMASIWGLASCNALQNIQTLQNRALRNAYDLPNQTNRVNMYTHLVQNHLPIRGIALVNIAMFIYKIEHGTTHSNIKFTHVRETYTRNLRNTSHIRPEPARTTYGTKSIVTFGPKIYNRIPESIKTCAHQHAFKWILKCHLRDSGFIKSCFDSTFFELHIRQ